MARLSKYKKKYARELEAGLRRFPDITEGGKEYSWSIERVCWKWGITVQTYYNWKNEYISFADACEIGDRDYKIYWMEKMEEGVTLGKSANGALLKLLAANILDMSDKKVVETKNDDKIHRIEIEVLPSRQHQIEKPNNVIDITPIKNKQ